MLKKISKIILISSLSIIMAFLVFKFIYTIKVVDDLGEIFEPNEEKTNEDFTYYIQNKKVVITGLSIKGKEKEIIIIPEKIDKYDVIKLSSNYKNNFYSKSLKVLVIKTHIKGDLQNLFYQCENLEKILYVSKDKLYRVNDGYCNDGLIRLNNSKDVYVYVEDKDIYAKGTKFENANVIYYVDDNLYYLDYIDNNKIAYKPSNPEKEGSKFLGWYTSDNKEFDFNTIIDSKLILHAVWG